VGGRAFRGRSWLLGTLLTTSGCGAQLSQLDVTTVHVSANEGEYGGYVLIAWAPLKDGSCPALARDTRVTMDGVPLDPEFLGGKHWQWSDTLPQLPYRRCIREARFKGPLPIPEGTPRTRVEVSDGKKLITLEVEALRAATRCRLLPPHQEILVRGERVTLECEPSAFTVKRASAAFGPAKHLGRESQTVERAGNRFSFLVPEDWSGKGVLKVDVEFEAPVLLCQNALACEATGRRIMGQTFDVEVR